MEEKENSEEKMLKSMNLDILMNGLNLQKQ